MRNRDQAAGLAGSWEWLHFAARLPAQPVPFTNVAAGQVLYPGRCIFLGATFNNAGTAAGRLDILDGLDGNGGIAWRFPAAASALGGGAVPSNGILMEVGVFLNPSGVTLTGAGLVIPLWHDRRTPPGD